MRQFTSEQLQYSTILVLIKHEQSTTRPNVRHGQSLGGRWCGISKIMSLGMLLKRNQGGAIANFDRDFIPQ